MINEISSHNDLINSVEIIKNSFKPVADQFSLTYENCPTHPSFITYEKLSELKNKGVRFFGLFVDSIQIGFIAAERGNEELFYIEKLAVLPEYRRKGYGTSLMRHAMEYVRKNKGTLISIGIINGHTILKNWYKKIGFEEIKVKQFKQLPFDVCFLELRL